VVAAARAALDLVAAEPHRRQQLTDNARSLRQSLTRLGLNLGAAPRPDTPGHIIPVLIGDASATMHVSERLLANDVFVQGIRPPTVPSGSARLRVTVMSTHTPADLEFAARQFTHTFASTASRML